MIFANRKVFELSFENIQQYSKNKIAMHVIVLICSEFSKINSKTFQKRSWLLGILITMTSNTKNKHWYNTLWRRKNLLFFIHASNHAYLGGEKLP